MLQVGILWFQQILKDGTLILLKQKIVQKLKKIKYILALGIKTLELYI